MSKVNRSICTDFVAALNHEYKSGSWWKKLIDDSSLFLGIRDEYVDVYFKGGRVLSLEYVNGELLGSTHFKYLVNLSRADTTNEYVKFKNGSFDWVGLKYPYRNIAENLAGIKKSMEPYQGEEKKGVHRIIMHNTNVVDTEIQFPGENRRVDFAALQKADNRIRLIFFEAKSYSNSEIRHPVKRPKVLDQIQAYERIIMKRRNEIADSYRQVAENITCLMGWNKRRSDTFADAAANGLEVDPEVRLVIFNFKEPQKKEANASGGDFTRLRDVLGKHRVLAKGATTKFERGIRFSE